MPTTIQNEENVERYTWGDVCDGWRLLDRPDLSVIQERIPPGAGEVTHVHERARQVFFVLRGQLRIDIDTVAFFLGVGDSLEIPPGEVHRVRNGAATDAVFLVISSPSARGDRTNL